MDTEGTQEALDLMERMGPIITGPDDPNVQLLHEPLRSCVWQGDGAFLMVKHPWVNSMVPFVGEVNRIYEAKFSMARRYLSEGNFEGYLWACVERPWRMSTLERWWDRGRLSTDDARRILVECWSDTESPTRNLWDPAYLWREIGFATDDQEGFDSLPDKLTVYGVEGEKAVSLGR